jgi:hypothetical protein
MADPANEPERVEPAGREPAVHCRLPIGSRGRRAQGLAREPKSRSHERRPIHLGVDRQTGDGLQHRSCEDLCQRLFQRWRHGFCAVLHAVRSDRGGRHGGSGANVAVELVHGPSSGSVDCVSRDGRPDGPVQRRSVVGRARTVSLGPDMDGELGSKKPLPATRSTRRWRQMSPVANTWIVLTTRMLCCTPSMEEAISGSAARRSPSGSSARTTAPSTPRVRCGCSFASTGS